MEAFLALLEKHITIILFYLLPKKTGSADPVF